MNDINFKNYSVIIEPSTPKLQTGLSADLRNVINERNMLTTRTKKKILTDLDEINHAYVENDRKNKRRQAIDEILSSEVYYLKQLQLIKSFFMKPIVDKKLLNKNEYQTLFGSIETISNINGELLRKLTQDPENVAEAFSNVAPFLKLYSVYAYEYKNALNVLQNVTATNQEFTKFLELQESRPEVHSKLSALLITPIQRVPRYRLLLKQLLENTNTQQPSYSLLIESLQKVEEAATHINNLVQEQENTQKLLEIQRSLQNGYPLIIKPGRKFIRDGILMKVSESKNRSYKRYFVLMSDILMYCKLKKDNPALPNSLMCSCILPLNKCKITEMLSKGAFKITCEDVTVTVHHDRAEYVKQWVEVLHESIKKYMRNRRTLRKDSSYRKPVHKKFLSEYQDLGISPGKPRRKRQLHEKSFQEVKKISDSSLDSDNETRNCFSFKPTKRKLIRNCDKESAVPSKKIKVVNDKGFDSLYPLRKQIVKKDQHSNELLEIKEECVDEVPDQNNHVFVFGENHDQPKGFRFTINNILLDLSKSIKRMFGFGQN